MLPENDDSDGSSRENPPLESNEKSKNKIEEGPISATELEELERLKSLIISESGQLSPAINDLIEFISKKASDIDTLKAKIILEHEETLKTVEAVKIQAERASQKVDKFQKTVLKSSERVTRYKTGWDRSNKKKKELLRECQELEKQLKETQEGRKRYKKISMEIIEKKNEEIEKWKMGESLVRKDEEVERMKQGHQKMIQEKNQILEDVKKEMKDLEENLKKVKMEKEKIHLAHSKLIHKKEEDLERLEKEKNVLEEKAKKTDNLEKQLKEIQKEMTKKNEEVEKMKKTNLKMMKGKEEEIEKLKKHQTQEIKEKKKEVDHLKVNNLHYINKYKNLNSTIWQKQEEKEVQMKQKIEELTENYRLLERNLAIKVKLLGAQILEKDRIIKNLQESNESMSSDTSTSSESPPESPTSSGAPNKFGYTLKSLQYKIDVFDINFLLKQAMAMRETIISHRPEIHEMANEEYLQYEERLKKYQRAIEMNIQLLKGSDVGFVIPIPEFPSLSSQFTAEYFTVIHSRD